MAEPDSAPSPDNAALDEAEQATPEGPNWIKLTQEADQISANFINSSLRTQWEKNLKHWQSKHAPGSKYNDPSFKNRSRLFRPKTRSTVRKHEAAIAQAMFSTRDVLSLEPEDDSNPQNKLAAAVVKAMAQYRLTKTIPWFMTVVGAFQDSEVMGACVSRQAWRYEERIVQEVVPEVMIATDPATGQATPMPVLDEATGKPKFTTADKIEVVKDEPEVKLFPLENVRFHPGADWIDPLNSSPFLQVRMPMFVGDVKGRAKPSASSKQKPWHQVGDGQLRRAIVSEADPTRQTREQNRQDSLTASEATAITDFTLVWVVENIMFVDGQDWVWWTLGTDTMLSDPITIEEAYWHCETRDRPYKMGISVVEAHKTYPSAKVELSEELQREANEIVNQRLDNVKLAMNGRIFVKSGANVDIPALLRHTPGGAVMMNNPETDVKVERAADVTQSSYAEQDRVNVDFDEVAGSFSPASVQSNRKLNETVGGMNLLAGASNAMIEYDLRVFTETWVEPVVRQIVLLEQIYETNPRVIMLAGQKGKMWMAGRPPAEQLPQIAAAAQEEVDTTVNVGFGSTDPMQRMGRITMAAQATGQIYGPAIQQRLTDELLDEIWGIAGFKDAKRFFNQPGADPQLQQAMAQIQELRKQLESKQMEAEAKVAVANINKDAKLTEQQLENEGIVTAEVVKAQLQMQIQPILLQMEQISEMVRASYEGRQAMQIADRDTANQMALADQAAAHGALAENQKAGNARALAADNNAAKSDQARVSAAAKGGGEGMAGLANVLSALVRTTQQLAQGQKRLEDMMAAEVQIERDEHGRVKGARKVVKRPEGVTVQ